MDGCRPRTSFRVESDFSQSKGSTDMSMGGLLWIIVVGFIAGLIARWLAPGPNNPSGFILTTIPRTARPFLATFIGQAIGHYGPDQGAGFIMATIGAVVVLFIWHRLVASGVIKG